jgi:hypothetical protein
MNSKKNNIMNRLRKILPGIIILSGMIFLASCVKGDLDVPPVIPPTSGLTANTTLTQLIAMHTPGALDSINTDVIISGIVVANDQSGNLYKQIYIEDDTSGIQIQLDQKNLFQTYKLGQRIFVKCKGLALGEYGGNMQLGCIINGAISRIPSDQIASHLFLEGFPGTVPAPILLTIPTFSAARLNMLVKLEGIHFADSGQVFSLSTATTNRNMLDAVGNTVPLRTSNYSDFASQIIPGGSGSVTGILSIFNGGYQFYIRDINDLSGFSK